MACTLKEILSQTRDALSERGDADDVVARIKVLAEIMLPLVQRVDLPNGASFHSAVIPREVAIKDGGLSALMEVDAQAYVAYPNGALEATTMHKKAAMSVAPMYIYKEKITPDIVRTFLTPEQAQGIHKDSITPDQPSKSGISNEPLSDYFLFSDRVNPQDITKVVNHLGYSEGGRIILNVNPLTPVVLERLGIDPDVAQDLYFRYEGLVEEKLSPVHKLFDDRRKRLEQGFSSFLSANEAKSKAFNVTQKYPNAFVNFITTQDDEVQRNRMLCLQSFLSLYETQQGVVSVYPKASISPFTKDTHGFFNKMEFILGNKGPTHDAIIKRIDEGFVPFKEVAAAHGIEHINNKEFMRAFSSEKPLSEALALSKLPPQWFYIKGVNNDTTNMLIDGEKYNGISSYAGSISHRYILGDALDTGRLIGKLQHSVHSENVSPDEKRQAQKTLKAELDKWSWLSKSQQPANVTISQLNEKYKADATLGDYQHNMSRLLESLEVRVLISHPDIEQSQFKIYMDDFKIGELEKMPFEYRSPRMELENVSYLARIKANAKLHNNITSVSTELSKYGKLNLQWEALHDGAENVGEYLFKPITNRFDLQAEGVGMQHCAYLYLNKCMSGDTSLVSIENLQGERVATLEVGQQPGDEDEAYLHNNRQCYGKNNEPVGEDVKDAVTAYLQKLDNGIITPNDITNAYFSNHEFPKEMSKFEICADLYEVPVLSDGVYYAAAYVDSFTPKGYSVMSALSNMSAYLDKSQFAQEIVLLESVAQHARVSLHEVIGVCIGGKENPRIQAIADKAISDIAPGVVSTEFAQRLATKKPEMTNNVKVDIPLYPIKP